MYSGTFTNEKRAQFAETIQSSEIHGLFLLQPSETLEDYLRQSGMEFKPDAWGIVKSNYHGIPLDKDWEEESLPQLKLLVMAHLISNRRNVFSVDDSLLDALFGKPRKYLLETFDRWVGY